MTEKHRVHLLVSGQVQGVFFRDFTQRRANELKLTGWVKNTRDSRVEIIAEGDKDRLEHLIEAVKTGPASANVQDCKIEWLEFSGEIRDFGIIYWD